MDLTRGSRVFLSVQLMLSGRYFKHAGASFDGVSLVSIKGFGQSSDTGTASVVENDPSSPATNV